MVTVFTNNFGQDYRSGKLKEKCELLFDICNTKGFTQEGFKIAVKNFIQKQRYQNWTLGDFFAQFTDNVHLKGYLDPNLTPVVKGKQHRIVPIEEAVASQTRDKTEARICKVDEEIDSILENIKLKCKIHELKRENQILKRQIKLQHEQPPELQAIEKLRQTHLMTPAEIIEGVRAFYNLEPGAIESQSRKMSIAIPRHVAIYLIRMIGYSVTDIGAAVGGRDHSTVLYAISEVKNYIEYDEAFKRKVQHLAKNVFHDFIQDAI